MQRKEDHSWLGQPLRICENSSFLVVKTEYDFEKWGEGLFQEKTVTCGRHRDGRRGPSSEWEGIELGCCEV